MSARWGATVLLLLVLLTPRPAAAWSRHRPPAPERFLAPAAGVVESRFEIRWGRLHTGVDIANDGGTPVHASASGRVDKVEWEGAYGLTVFIVHGGAVSTVYAHLADASVVAGDMVDAGQVIGSMGSTGNATGTHVHFEVRRHDQPVDPFAAGLQLPPAPALAIL